MQAFRKHTMEPVIIARTANDEMLDLCAGHIVLKLPTIIPSDPKFAKPHIANVHIDADRFYNFSFSINRRFSHQPIILSSFSVTHSY